MHSIFSKDKKKNQPVPDGKMYKVLNLISIHILFFFVQVSLVTFLLLHLALCSLLTQRPSIYYLVGICHIDQLYVISKVNTHIKLKYFWGIHLKKARTSLVGELSQLFSSHFQEVLLFLTLCFKGSDTRHPLAFNGVNYELQLHLYIWECTSRCTNCWELNHSCIYTSSRF